MRGGKIKASVALERAPTSEINSPKSGIAEASKTVFKKKKIIIITMVIAEISTRGYRGVRITYR